MGNVYEVDINGFVNKAKPFAPFTIKTSSLGSDLPGSSGDYLKMRYAFLADEKFVRVYEDDVLLRFTTDWEFILTAERLGAKTVDMTDGVKILSASAGATYRLEVDEYPLAITPPIQMWRNDGHPLRGGNALAVKNAPYGSMDANVTQNDLYEYETHYDGGDIVLTFCDRLGCGWFRPGADFSTELGWGTWRLEVYKIGRNARSKGKNAGVNRNNGMDKCLTPRSIVTTNEVDITTANRFANTIQTAVKSGVYLLRLRETTRNIVTNFSAQRMFLRRLGVRSRDYSTGWGFINKSGVM